MNKPIMDEKKPKELPGILQSFHELISYDRLYVDKTPYIYSMVKDPALNYLFLSRPRRFGKTILLDTIKELFLGRRHLFENLWISRETGYDFRPYPVIRLSMNYAKTDSPEQLEDSIIFDLLNAAKSMDITVPEKNYGIILKALLASIYGKHGAGSVILIDEYDAPVAGHIGDPDLAQANSKVLHGFYTTLKSSFEHIRFVFVTGITRFAMTALDSGPNNFKDISLLPEYGGVCGFTVSEFDRYFGDRMEDLLKAQTESGYMPPDSRVSDLREKILAWYDGYNWLGPERVLNPYALVNLFSDKKFAKYWVASGQPSHLKAMIRQRPQDFLAPQIEEYFSSEIRKADLQHLDPAPILFHSGCLTIDREIIHPGDSSADDSDDDEPSYTFKFPNKEVKNGYSGILKDVFGKAGYGSI
ncbi:MAG: AAA family ATPase, partial [Deltaproteobacteria bacterium]|nr:AAA family ATPase [Deltaproteobacteria bacterium]